MDRNQPDYLFLTKVMKNITINLFMYAITVNSTVLLLYYIGALENARINESLHILFIPFILFLFPLCLLTILKSFPDLFTLNEGRLSKLIIKFIPFSNFIAKQNKNN